jgi:hypothetical protein
MKQKKASGLGKGLDELLEDNHPTSRASASTGKPLVVAKGEVVSEEAKKTVAANLYGSSTKSLYDTKPRTKSVKSNFKK